MRFLLQGQGAGAVLRSFRLKLEKKKFRVQRYALSAGDFFLQSNVVFETYSTEHSHGAAD